MRNKILKTAACFLCCILLIACNNIFVDPIPDMEERIQLDGYNGSKTVKLYKKGLTGISFDDDFSYSWQPVVTYYGHDGETINNPGSVNEVSKATYYSRFFALEFNIKGDEAEIVALNNAYTDPVSIILYLHYDYTVKTVEIEIGVGKPYEITNFGHVIDDYITTTDTVKGISQTIHNNTSRPVNTTIYPYKEAPSRLTLTPAKGDEWSDRACGITGVPYFKNGEWTVYDTEDVEATIGAATSFTSQAVDPEEEAYVEVPPNSSVRVEISVIYATLKTGYSAIVRMPNMTSTGL